MQPIKDYYLDTWGSTLMEVLKDELSGDFLNACLCWISAADPTQGLEYSISDMKAAGQDIADEKLLQEKANLIEFVAQSDAVAVHSACAGMGTDDCELIAVICGRTKGHLARVNAYYHSLYEKSLLEVVHSETDGYYRQLLEYALMPEDEVDCFTVKEACDGFGKYYTKQYTSTVR
jgi:Annexin